MSENIIAQLETMLSLMEEKRELLHLIRVERDRRNWAAEATKIIKRTIGSNIVFLIHPGGLCLYSHAVFLNSNSLLFAYADENEWDADKNKSDVEENELE